MANIDNEYEYYEYWNQQLQLPILLRAFIADNYAQLNIFSVLFYTYAYFHFFHIRTNIYTSHIPNSQKFSWHFIHQLLQ